MQHPRTRLKCWEGHESETITQPISARTGATFEVECLTSGGIPANNFLTGEYKNWDALNANNAYIKNCLEPAGLISKLDESRFLPALPNSAQQFRDSRYTIPSSANGWLGLTFLLMKRVTC
jgi:hypothetical protein